MSMACAPAELAAAADLELARHRVLEQRLDLGAVAARAVGLVAGRGMHQPGSWCAAAVPRAPPAAPTSAAPASRRSSARSPAMPRSGFSLAAGLQTASVASRAYHYACLSVSVQPLNCRSK